jgi:endonuclease-3
VPDEFEALVSLPGVGRKTANVVLSNAFGIDAIAVDTHVFRVSNRIGLARSDNVLETEKMLMRAIPKDKWSAAHHWLIWHGREVCTARNPKCNACILNKLCEWPQKKRFTT